MSTYSIRYSSDYFCCDCAVDWSWNVQDKWARSERDGIGSAWITDEGLDEKAYEALLTHFGLGQWIDEFPPDRIIFMSPWELAQERRKKEIRYKLERQEMKSDTLGYHIRAEDMV